MKRIILLSAALIACGIAILAVISCEREATPVRAPRSEPDAVYSSRGRVLMLPEAGKPLNELQIHHEAIDTMVNPNGTVGMPVMIMPFPVADGVSLSGLAVGDLVEFTFAHWTKPGQRGYEVTSISKLPPDTKLDLGE